MNTLCTVDELLVAARRDRRALGELLESYRGRLMRKSQRRLSRIERRCDAADIVQQTLAEALDRFPGFVGSVEPEFSAWIGVIHRHVIENAVRVHVQAQKRSVARETALYFGHGSAALPLELASDESTPSTRLMRGEKAARLMHLLDSLPERQAFALRMRFYEKLPMRDLADLLGTSELAAAGLIKRGLRNLRQRLHELSWR
ncbi:MAG: sigma-70 family RNA polymerase sigma factor [Pirellulales bacterium]